MSKLIKYSPFQRKTLSLYAEFVRLAKNKPGLLERARSEFRAASKLNTKTDSLQIDFKLRRARNQLDMLKTSNVKAVKLFRLE